MALAHFEQQYSELLPVIQGIVYHLNMGADSGAWKLKPQGAEVHPSFELANGEAVLYMRLADQHSSKPARLTIGGIVPRGKDGQYFKVYEERTTPGQYNEVTAPGITVAVSRGSEAIAREIARRFLPQYLRVVGLALLRIHESESYESKRFSNLLVCANIMGEQLTAPYGHNRRVEERTEFSAKIGEVIRVEVKASASDIDLKLENLTVLQACAVLEFVKSQHVRDDFAVFGRKA